MNNANKNMKCVFCTPVYSHLVRYYTDHKYHKVFVSEVTSYHAHYIWASDRKRNPWSKGEWLNYIVIKDFNAW